MSAGAFLLLILGVAVVIVLLCVFLPGISIKFNADNKAMKRELLERRKIMTEIRQEAIRYQQIESQLPNVILDILNNYEIKELN